MLNISCNTIFQALKEKHGLRHSQQAEFEIAQVFIFSFSSVPFGFLIFDDVALFGFVEVNFNALCLRWKRRSLGHRGFDF